MPVVAVMRLDADAVAMGGGDMGIFKHKEKRMLPSR